jgi:hypothetical protein
MTLLQLTSGKEIRVQLSYEEIRDLLEKAIATGKLLELARHDGMLVLVNPNNVDYIQNGTGEGPGPAREQDLRGAPA